MNQESRIMRRASGIFLSTLGIFMMYAAMAEKSPTTAPERKRRIVIATKMLLDGRGHVLPETRIVVEDSKIVKLDPKAAPIDYDLRGFTVMPGWVDSHVHITWSFGPDGK